MRVWTWRKKAYSKIEANTRNTSSRGSCAGVTASGRMSASPVKAKSMVRKAFELFTL